MERGMSKGYLSKKELEWVDEIKSNLSILDSHIEMLEGRAPLKNLNYELQLFNL